MAKQIARDFDIKVSDGNATPSMLTIDYTSYSMSFEKTIQDVSTQANAGWMGRIATQMGFSLTVETIYMSDDSTRDATQTRLDALGLLVGPAGVTQFELAFPDGSTWSFDGIVKATPANGGVADAAKISYEISSTGAVVVA